MSDCADILPRILELHSLATKDPNHALTKSELSRGCEEYEAAMIPRAFTWVRKSGGSKVPVIAPYAPSKPASLFVLHLTSECLPRCGDDGKGGQ